MGRVTSGSVTGYTHKHEPSGLVFKFKSRGGTRMGFHDRQDGSYVRLAVSNPEKGGKFAWIFGYHDGMGSMNLSNPFVTSSQTMSGPWTDPDQAISDLLRYEALVFQGETAS